MCPARCTLPSPYERTNRAAYVWLSATRIAAFYTSQPTPFVTLFRHVSWLLKPHSAPTARLHFPILCRIICH